MIDGREPFSMSNPLSWLVSTRRRRVGTILLVPIVVLLSTALFVFVHDDVIFRADRSEDCAWFKSEVLMQTTDIRPWCWDAFDRARPQPGPDQVELQEDGPYVVPKRVERLEADGSWTRRMCTIRLWRESYDVWHYQSLQIEGEPICELGVVDGPTGCRLWLPIQFEL